jgi:hypothetical protein
LIWSEIKMKQVLFILLGGILLSSCVAVEWVNSPWNPMVDNNLGWFVDNDFASNGEQIYFTAINDSGRRIRYTSGQNFGGMMMSMGANLACVSCHASDGRGGIHTMHMEVMDAPDIRYSVLAGNGDEHGDDHGHDDEHTGYDLDDFRVAVIGGAHPDGEPLSRDMPRWRMSDQDLADLFEYLKTLP